MRKYELAFIVHPELDDSAFNDVVEKVKGWITQNGGNVLQVDMWGKRSLAYPIRKQKEGQYVLMRVEMTPASCPQLERNLRFLEPILRFLIVLVK